MQVDKMMSGLITGMDIPFGQIGGVLALLAFIPYIASTLKGRTRPSRATWFIWSVLGAIILLSYHSLGARDTIWVPLGYAIGPLIIALLSIRHGVGGWSRLDRICLAGAGAGIALWASTKDPLAPLLSALAMDAFGAIPTIRKTAMEPFGEDALAWSLFLTANSFNLLAVEAWTMEMALYPAYMFSLSLIMIALIARGGLRRV